MKLHEIASVEVPLLVSMLEKLRPKMHDYLLYYQAANAVKMDRVVDFTWRKDPTLRFSQDPVKQNRMVLDVRTANPNGHGDPWVGTIPEELLDHYTVRKLGDRFVLTWKQNKLEDSHEGE
jgi:hypothetical protein